MCLQNDRTASRGLVSLAVLWVFCCVPGCADRPATQTSAGAGSTKKLTIITPHNERIRSAFETGFSDWHHANYGTHVDIQWIVRGTPECVAYIDRVFSAHVDARPRTLPDLMFGGGIDDHRILAARGLSRSVRLGDALEGLPAEVAGLPTRDPEGHWFATGLSSFGIVYNERLCREYDINPPATWEDLADPRFRSWVAVADPANSGSHRQCMVLILQHLGWKEGWPAIIRILANARALVDRSADVLLQVRAGIAMAGFAVNFDGMTLAADNDGAIGYVNPHGATAATPSVTSVLESATELELAGSFLRYCLSEPGQLVWSVRSSAHSAYSPTLYHYPLSPAIYRDFADDLSVSENPLQTDFGIRLDLERADQQVSILTPLVRAACGENHVLLQRAWKAVIDAGMPTEALHVLTSPPFDESTAYEFGQIHRDAEPAQARKMEEEWSAMFRVRYQRVVELAANGQARIRAGETSPVQFSQKKFVWNNGKWTDRVANDLESESPQTAQ